MKRKFKLTKFGKIVFIAMVSIVCLSGSSKTLAMEDYNKQEQLANKFEKDFEGMKKFVSYKDNFDENKECFGFDVFCSKKNGLEQEVLFFIVPKNEEVFEKIVAKRNLRLTFFDYNINSKPLFDVVVRPYQLKNKPYSKFYLASVKVGEGGNCIKLTQKYRIGLNIGEEIMDDLGKRANNLKIDFSNFKFGNVFKLENIGKIAGNIGDMIKGKFLGEFLGSWENYIAFNADKQGEVIEKIEKYSEQQQEKRLNTAEIFFLREKDQGPDDEYENDMLYYNEDAKRDDDKYENDDLLYVENPDRGLCRFKKPDFIKVLVPLSELGIEKIDDCRIHFYDGENQELFSKKVVEAKNRDGKDCFYFIIDVLNDVFVFNEKYSFELKSEKNHALLSTGNFEVKFKESKPVEGATAKGLDENKVFEYSEEPPELIFEVGDFNAANVAELSRKYHILNEYFNNRTDCLRPVL